MNVKTLFEVMYTFYTKTKCILFQKTFLKNIKKVPFFDSALFENCEGDDNSIISF
jgi:hypothetical protein